MFGYLSTDYHNSLLEDLVHYRGLPFMVRPVGDYKELLSVYPFLSRGQIPEFVISSIIRELDESKEYVCSTIVTDPMDDPPQVYDNSILDVFRTHYIVDLQSWSIDSCIKNTKKNIKVAIRNNDSVTVSTSPSEEEIEMFYTVYQNTVRKHNVTGICNFSKLKIEKQLKSPGAVLVYCNEDNLGMQFYFVQGSNVYWHLSGYTELGYARRASYRLSHSAIMFFKNLGFKKLILGSGAGNPGLEQYKKGLSTESKDNYMIKTIHNQEVYDKLAIPGNSFFPAFRIGL